jgi:hypothetical protein
MVARTRATLKGVSKPRSARSAGRGKSSRKSKTLAGEPPVAPASKLGQARKRLVTVLELRRMTESRSSDQRLLALMLMRKKMDRDKVRKAYFSMARRLIEDANNNCRWQAMIVIGYFIDDHPEDVWEVVERYGQHEDEDMRIAVATVLLEHLLDEQPKRFKKRTVTLAAHSPRFAETLKRCWSFSQPRIVEECLRAAANQRAR